MKRYKLPLTRIFPRINANKARKLLARISSRFTMRATRIYANIFSVIWPRTIKSHPVSKALRPLFENKNSRKGLGAGLILLVLTFGQFNLSVAAFQPENQEQEMIILEEVEPQVKTDTGIQAPLKEFSISQGYWFFHKAIDMTASKGVEIKPIMEGKVISINQGGWPWGKAVKINHGSDLVSFYAHMAEIEVKEGQGVNQETVLGKVGATGRATGVHLHLEIHQNGQAINPLTVIGD